MASNQDSAVRQTAAGTCSARAVQAFGLGGSVLRILPRPEIRAISAAAVLRRRVLHCRCTDDLELCELGHGVCLGPEPDIAPGECSVAMVEKQQILHEAQAPMAPVVQPTDAARPKRLGPSTGRVARSGRRQRERLV